MEYIFNKEKNNMILEPMCCLLRICLIVYKSDNIKISIQNNSIKYIENNGLQSIIRTYYGDTRNDLHNLYAPILKAFEWYPASNNIYKYIYNSTLKGYNKFMNVYDKNSIIYHTLNHYKILLQEYINGNKNVELQVGSSPLIDNLKSMWSEDEINIVYNILLLIEKSNDTDIYIKILEELLDFKEKKVYDYIIKNSGSYDS
jgi:hypothetical protein